MITNLPVHVVTLISFGDGFSRTIVGPSFDRIDLITDFDLKPLFRKLSLLDGVWMDFAGLAPTRSEALENAE